MFGRPRRRPLSPTYNRNATVAAIIVSAALLLIVCLWALNFTYPA